LRLRRAVGLLCPSAARRGRRALRTRRYFPRLGTGLLLFHFQGATRQPFVSPAALVWYPT